MNTVGVIIVSFNTCALLRDCLRSLCVCTLPLQITVVDNGSHDGSPAMVRADFPEVTLLEPGKNLGFARANNIALGALLGQPAADTQKHMFSAMNPAAVPDYLLLLNPDTVVHAHAIETMVAFLQAHPRVGMVGPRLLNPDGTLQHAAFRFPTLFMTVLDLFPPGEVLPGRLYGSWWHGRYPQEQHSEIPFPIDHPLGACMLVRRSTIEQVGGMDEAFFMYSEEVEWCLRIRRAGWAIFQVPAARVTHVGGAATGQFRSRMLLALWESRLRLLQQYSPHTVGWHRRIIRLGMVRAALVCWRDWAQGGINREALRSRLWTFGQVFRL